MTHWTARALRDADTRTLREAILHGHPIEPAALEGWAYRGTSLGLPRIAERLTWKTFQKTFYREPGTGRLVGWNVRLEQDGVDAPSRPKVRRGRPITEWHYEVVPPGAVRHKPAGFDRGLMIDYSLGANPPGVIQLSKDPLVALRAGSADELIGVTYLTIAGVCVETPTYFTLEREHRIDHVPYDDPAPAAVDPLRLTAIERGWAEALFEGIVATGASADEGDEGLPAFADVDRDAMWRAFEESPSPLVRAGLRPMLHTLVFLPVVSGFGRPFFALSREERARFLASIDGDRRYFVRQSLNTLKMLACFAYFDDPTVRARFEGAGGDR
jgi:hypothetical protein